MCVFCYFCFCLHTKQFWFIMLNQALVTSSSLEMILLPPVVYSLLVYLYSISYLSVYSVILY